MSRRLLPAPEQSAAACASSCLGEFIDHWLQTADCELATWICCACRGELYPCETNVRLCDELETDEEVEVNMESDVLTVLRTGKQYPLTPIGDVSPYILGFDQGLDAS